VTRKDTQNNKQTRQNNCKYTFLAKLLRYVRIMSSQIRLLFVSTSSVTLVHTDRVKLFGDIFEPSNSLRTQAVCLKIWGRRSKAL